MGKACPFCDRIDRDEFSIVAASRPCVVGFAPLNPVTDGHMLFVPWEHCRDAAERPDLAAAAVEFAAAYAAREGIEDFNLITSKGSAATQTVMHLHVHLVPRFDGDGLALPWTGQRRG